MKKYTQIILYTTIYSVIIAVVGYIVGRPSYMKRETTTLIAPQYTNVWSVVKSDALNLQFKLPSFVSVSENESKIAITHTIPFVHNDYCDFVGNKPQLETLDDITLSLSVSDDVVRTTLLKTLGGNDDVNAVLDSSNNFILQPDFVEAFKIGSLIGHRVRFAVEGCGMNYYFIPFGSRILIAHIPEHSDLYDTSSQYHNYKDLLEPDPYSWQMQEQLLKDIVSTMRPLK